MAKQRCYRVSERKIGTMHDYSPCNNNAYEAAQIVRPEADITRQSCIYDVEV